MKSILSRSNLVLVPSTNLILILLSLSLELYYDRRSVGQSVLVSSPHLRLMTRFSLLSDNCVSVDMGRPLWREDGLSFTIAAVFDSAVILGSESRGAHDHILLSQIWGSTNLEDQVPVFISPRKRVARLYPQALGLPLILLANWCPFITSREPNIDHHVEQLIFFCYSPVTTGMSLLIPVAGETVVVA
jgi:hypothetical protein